MIDSTQQILVIAGPTATGKTALALAVARALDGELIGADSVQVYRGFDIGSAKPTIEELDGVPHHLVDVIDPNEDIDAATYATRADAAIAEIAGRQKLPIVVGGTGLWIRALVRGLVSVPKVDPELRARLEGELDELGSAALHDRLRGVDPDTADNVHPNDAFRIVRALEVFAQTGTPLGTLRKQHALGAPRYQSTLFVTACATPNLDTRIEQRIEGMFALGLVDEVRQLRAQWGDTVRAMGSVGYKETLEHLRDAVPMDETKRRIRKSTRTYARRQRTWFRSSPDVHATLDVDESFAPEAWVERVRRALNR